MYDNIGKLIKLKIKFQIQRKEYKYNNKSVEKKVEKFCDKSENFCITFLNKLWKFV